MLPLVYELTAYMTANNLEQFFRSNETVEIVAHICIRWLWVNKLRRKATAFLETVLWTVGAVGLIVTHAVVDIAAEWTPDLRMI